MVDPLLCNKHLMSYKCTGGSATWTPADITTTLWLDGDDASTIQHVLNLVYRWDDKSTVGANDATQAEGSRQPLTGSATIGGLNTISFSGSQLLDIDVLLSSGEYSLFMVTTPTAGTEDYIISSNGIGSSPAILSKYDGKDFEFYGDSPRLDIVSSAVGDAAIIGVTSVSGGLSTTYLGEVEVSSGTGTTAFTTTAFSRIGRAGSINYASCNIGEIVITPDVLPSSDIGNLVGYLSDKWSI